MADSILKPAMNEEARASVNRAYLQKSTVEKKYESETGAHLQKSPALLGFTDWAVRTCIPCVADDHVQRENKKQCLATEKENAPSPKPFVPQKIDIDKELESLMNATKVNLPPFSNPLVWVATRV